MSALREALEQARSLVEAASVSREETGVRTAALIALDAAVARLGHDGRPPRKDLLSVICHDLKDPLASVVMGAGFLRKVLPQDETSASARRVVDAIHRSADRMNQVILDFYDLGKMELGSLKLDPRPMDIAGAVRAAFDAHKAAAAQKGLTLTLESIPDEGKVSVFADRARVIQIVSKILANAVKFTPEKGTITVNVDERETDVRVRVTDTGRGVSAERKESIFDRDANARQTPRDGPGLGLPIAKGLINLQNGTIGVESEGKGSTFFFTLPKSSTSSA
jgi:signal transduction histidine kinase